MRLKIYRYFVMISSCSSGDSDDSTPAPTTDPAAPSASTNHIATSISTTSINLSCTASKDNVFNADSNSVFIQLHSFSKNATNPYVILSNGTRETPPKDYVTQIKDALLVEDNSLTFKFAHIDTGWTRLIGFNTQEQLTSSSYPCIASEITGRFIHIEQERTTLRESTDEWIKMSNTLKSVFNKKSITI